MKTSSGEVDAVDEQPFARNRRSANSLNRLMPPVASESPLRSSKN